ncbi:MAG: hypothetical protein ACTSVY_09645 [Candidatus Helarchaeota archaeon]
MIIHFFLHETSLDSSCNLPDSNEVDKTFSSVSKHHEEINNISCSTDGTVKNRAIIKIVHDKCKEKIYGVNEHH